MKFPLLEISCIPTRLLRWLCVPLDAGVEGTKRGGPVEKGSSEKVQGSSPALKEEGKEGPSVEVKEEEGTEPADVKPNKDALKPQGEKYSPKVSLLLSTLRR